MHTHVSHCLQPEKIIEVGAKKINVAVMAMKKAEECLCLFFLKLWSPTILRNQLSPKYIFR